MSVRAKFRVLNSTVPESGPASVMLYPVYSGSEENAAFYAAAPGGQIQLELVSRKVAAEFEVGDEFYVTFEKAPKAAEAETVAE